MVELESIGQRKRVRNYVDGDWRDASGDDELTSVNPATGEELATVPFSSAADVDEIVRSGNEAFEAWSDRPVEERIQPLFRLKSLLEAHQEELAELLVEDHGKTIAEARGELRRGIENVEVACGIPSMMQSGSLLNAAPNIDEKARSESRSASLRQLPCSTSRA